ncbi:MAG: hypothetical protein IJ848_03745 [Alphaproteobacteria bacterium]|nr:hypothetical protein [Alphaproteobacteria bacterium]
MYYVVKRSSRLSIKIAVARDEGKEEGLIEGENKAKKELALNMKNQGLSNDFIAKCLNISIEELNALCAL